MKHVLTLCLALCLTACYPTPAPSYQARGPATVIAQATQVNADLSAALAQQAQERTETAEAITQAASTQAALRFERDSTSTSVVNAATALALTPTAQALALKMAAESDSATQSAQATGQKLTATLAAAPTRAAETQAAQSQAATAQADLAAARRYDETLARSRAQQTQRNWDSFWQVIEFTVLGFIVASSCVGVAFLAGLAWQKIAKLKFQAQQEKAKALIELVRRSGNGLIRIDMQTGQVEAIQVEPGPETAGPPAVRDTAHVPIVWHESDQDPLTNPALVVVEAAIDYQRHNPDWPSTQIPRWDKLDLSADLWSKATASIEHCLSIRPGKGTYINSNFEDLADLRQQILSGNVAVR